MREAKAGEEFQVKGTKFHNPTSTFPFALSQCCLKQIYTLHKISLQNSF